MLKGIKLELVGIALIAIFLITVTTLSFGPVNASSTVPSKNGKVASPAPNITVDTPYGKVLVTPEYYKSVGKEQIIKDQKEFMEQRDQLIKMGFINTSRESSYTTNFPLDSQTSAIKSSTLTRYPTAYSQPRDQERCYFTPKTGYSPNYLYGYINPLSSGTLPSDVLQELDEFELFPSGTNDLIEIIAEHEGNGNQRNIQYALYNGNPGGPQYYNNVFTNIDHGVEFYFNYNTALLRYETRFYDPVTHTSSQIYTYSDPYIGSSLGMICGSCEFSYTSPNPPTCHIETIAEQWVARSGSTFYNPSDVFDYRGLYGGNAPHVDPLTVDQIYGHYIVTLKSGSDVV